MYAFVLFVLINIDINIECLSNHTWAVTELSIELFIGIPSWLMTIVPITFFVSWILFKVSFTSPAKMICCPLLAALLRNAYNICYSIKWIEKDILIFATKYFNNPIGIIHSLNTIFSYAWNSSWFTSCFSKDICHTSHRLWWFYNILITL